MTVGYYPLSLANDSLTCSTLATIATCRYLQLIIPPATLGVSPDQGTWVNHFVRCCQTRFRYRSRGVTRLFGQVKLSLGRSPGSRSQSFPSVPLAPSLNMLILSEFCKGPGGDR